MPPPACLEVDTVFVDDDEIIGSGFYAVPFKSTSDLIIRHRLPAEFLSPSEQVDYHPECENAVAIFAANILGQAVGEEVTSAFCAVLRRAQDNYEHGKPTFMKLSEVA